MANQIIWLTLVNQIEIGFQLGLNCDSQTIGNQSNFFHGRKQGFLFFVWWRLKYKWAGYVWHRSVPALSANEFFGGISSRGFYGFLPNFVVGFLPNFFGFLTEIDVKGVRWWRLKYKWAGYVWHRHMPSVPRRDNIKIECNTTTAQSTLQQNIVM